MSGTSGQGGCSFAGGILPFTTARIEPWRRAALLSPCWDQKCAITSEARIQSHCPSSCLSSRGKNRTLNRKLWQDHQTPQAFFLSSHPSNSRQQQHNIFSATNYWQTENTRMNMHTLEWKISNQKNQICTALTGAKMLFYLPLSKLKPEGGKY